MVYDPVYQKAYREANKERRREYNKKHRQENQSHYTQLALEWRKSNIIKSLLIAIKYRTQKSGIEFNLLEEDIVVPDVCPVFKIPFVRNTPFAASIDRVDSSKGYTKDNVQVISRKANTMKNNATKDELRQFAEWVLSSV